MMLIRNMQMPIAILSAILMTTLGCGDDAAVAVDAAQPPDAEETADGGVDAGPTLLFGRVTTADGAGMPFVRVRSLDGILSGSTDESGTYVFDDDVLADYADDDVINLKFQTEGHSEGFITLSVSRGISMKADAQLSPFEEVWAAVDPTITNNLFNSDIALDIPANSLLDDAGNPLAQPVNISVLAGDPSDERESELMPGNYWADDGGGEIYLDSVAFANIEIRTMSGTEISDINDNTPVALKLRVPTNMVDSGAVQEGDTIPWWTFDEVRGTWVQEGEARVYLDEQTFDLWTTSDITHLSWFNVDRRTRNACLCGRVVDENGNPLPGQLVQSFGSNHNTSYRGTYTDANGDACFSVARSGYPNTTNSYASQAYVGSGPRASRRPFPNNPSTHPVTQINCTKNAFPCRADCLDIGSVEIRMRGAVSGTVTDKNGNPLAGVRVVSSTGATATTDAMGRYSVVVPLDTPFSLSISGGGVLSTTSGTLTATDAMPDLVQDFSAALPKSPILRSIDSDVQNSSRRTPIQCPNQPCGYSANIDVADPSDSHTVSITLWDANPDALSVSPGPYRCIETGGASQTDTCIASSTSGPSLIDSGPGMGRYQSTFTFTCGSNLTMMGLDQCDVDFTVIDDANNDGVPEFQYDINTVVTK